MFSGKSQIGTQNSILGRLRVTSRKNGMNDFEVESPPEDTVAAMEFSPATLKQNFLIAGGWDNRVRCWEVETSGKTIPKLMTTMGGPVFDVSWSDDGSQVFIATGDGQVNMWNLATNQTMQVAAHDLAVKTCHWIKGNNYSCVMTGSWDKTVKFWDTRTPKPMLTLPLPERLYAAAVEYPLAVTCTAGRGLTFYSLENTPTVFEQKKNPLAQQSRAVAIFKNKQNVPSGCAVCTVEGRVAIQYVKPRNLNDNFTFKCHRTTGNPMEIYVVNDLAFHPQHNTLATVGSDGTFNFWDKDTRAKLKSSVALEQPLTKCCFSACGQIFAYALGYDWSKGHEYFSANKTPRIFLRSCFDEMKPRG